MTTQAGTGRTMGATEWVMLLTLAMLWGGSFFFNKVALAELHPFTIVLGRVALAAVALNLAVVAMGQRMPRGGRAWGSFLTMGLLNNVAPFSLILWGQTRIPSGLAAILNATTPLFTVVVAHLLTRDERLSPRRVAGVLCGLVGVGIMVGPEALAGFDRDLLARVAVLGAAISYAFAAVYGRRFRDRPALVTAAGQLSATTIVMLPVALLVDRPWTAFPLEPRTVGAMLGIGLLSTAVAYVLYFRILAASGATNTALVTLLAPVGALLLGAVILGERLEPREALGMAAIGLGLLTIDGRLLDRARRWRAPRPSSELAGVNPDA